MTWVSSSFAAPPMVDIPTIDELYPSDSPAERDTKVYKVWITIDNERQKVSVRLQQLDGCLACFRSKWIEGYIWIKTPAAVEPIRSRVFFKPTSKICWNSEVVYHATPKKRLPSVPVSHASKPSKKPYSDGYHPLI